MAFEHGPTVTSYRASALKSARIVNLLVRRVGSTPPNRRRDRAFN